MKWQLKNMFNNWLVVYEKDFIVDIRGNEANARLIASAPELLEACKKSLEIVDSLPCECDDYHGFTCGKHDWYRQLERAIAKATGEGVRK